MYMYVCVFFHPNKSVTVPAATMQKRRRGDFAKAQGYPRLTLYIDHVYIYYIYDAHTSLCTTFSPKNENPPQMCSIHIIYTYKYI